MTKYGYTHVRVLWAPKSIRLYSTEPDVVQRFLDAVAKEVHPSDLKVLKFQSSGKPFDITVKIQTALDEHFMGLINQLCQDGWEPFSSSDRSVPSTVSYAEGQQSIEFRKVMAPS